MQTEASVQQFVFKTNLPCNSAKRVIKIVSQDIMVLPCNRSASNSKETLNFETKSSFYCLKDLDARKPIFYEVFYAK